MAVPASSAPHRPAEASADVEAAKESKEAKLARKKQMKLKHARVLAKGSGSKRFAALRRCEPPDRCSVLLTAMFAQSVLDIFLTK